MALCKIPTYLHRYNPDSITHKRNIPKEVHAYKTIIEEFCNSIDDKQRGCQMELILNTLLQVLNSEWFEPKEKEELKRIFINQNTFLESVFLNLYFTLKNEVHKLKVLHLLIRYYKRNLLTKFKHNNC